MRKVTARPNKTLPIALVFSACVLLIILGWFLVRFFTLISVGKFDPNHQFLFVLEKTATDGELFVISPQTNSLVKAEITHATAIGKVGKQIGLPIDEYIADYNGLDASSLFQQEIFSLSNKQLAWIDAVQLWWYMHAVKADAVQQVSLSLDKPLPLSTLPLFTDKSLFDENKTVAIINASGISGKGSLLATLLENIGANVISVTSGQERSDSQIITELKDSYTTHRLQSILGMHVQASQPRPAIADIVIIIGKDTAQSAIF